MLAGSCCLLAIVPFLPHREENICVGERCLGSVLEVQLQPRFTPQQVHNCLLSRAQALVS